MIPRIVSEEDLNAVFHAVNKELRFSRHDDLVASLSVNPEVNRRIQSAFSENVQAPSMTGLDSRKFVHASIGGVRSAHEILKDGFVSSQYPCTDWHVLIMAVLRHHGIPCRLVRAIGVERNKQTSLFEVKLGGKPYRLKHIPGETWAVSSGFVRAGYPLSWIEYSEAA